MKTLSSYFSYLSKIQWILFVSVILFIIASLSVVFFVRNERSEYNTLETVKGTSMEPLLHDGQEIRIKTTDIFPIHRGDVIIYDYTHGVRSDVNSIVKRIVAMSGDTWTYENQELTVNGKLVKNSEGVPYHFDSQVLSLYARDYPTIPPGMLLILGNISSGSLDSSKFGLIPEKDLEGKVLMR